jgi:hypothetical protein
MKIIFFCAKLKNVQCGSTQLRKEKQLMKNATIALNLIYNKYNKIEFENEVFNIDHLNASHLETILDILREREMWNSSIERIFGLAIFTVLNYMD